jgi:hypothetical protein
VEEGVLRFGEEEAATTLPFRLSHGVRARAKAFPRLVEAMRVQPVVLLVAAEVMRVQPVVLPVAVEAMWVQPVFLPVAILLCGQRILVFGRQMHSNKPHRQTDPCLLRRHLLLRSLSNKDRRH